MNAKLLETLTDETAGAGADEAQEPVYVFPATFAQRRLWFLQQLEPGQTSYLVAIAWRMSGALNVAAVNFAMNRLVERHDTMRTSFAVESGEPVQVVHPYAAFEVAVEDLSERSDPESAAQTIVVGEANTPFDLAVSPLFRCRILRVAADEHVLLFTTHHIVFDGWSKGVWMREFTAFYREFVSGEQANMPELEIQYGDFAAWQQEQLSGAALENHVSFWMKALEGAPQLLELPKDRARTRIVSPEGASVHFTIDAAIAARLRMLARETNSTLFMVLLAAFHVLMARYTGQQDIVVGTPIANRERLELEPLIGVFNNLLLMRGRVTADASFLDVLAAVKAFTLDAYAHQDMPFEKLVELLQPERSLSYNPLFQVMFALHNTPREAPTLPGLTLATAPGGRLKTKLDLAVSVVDGHGGLKGVAEYSAALFDPATIERMLAHFERLLGEVSKDAAALVCAVPLLTVAEQQRQVVEWNETAAEYPRDKCLHEVIAENAVNHPQNTAVAFGDERLSYEDLEERSNRLANYLRASGVGRGQRVGVCLERSLDLIVSLLAVMKTGAAYVPLDPHYPASRLQLILEDADVSSLVTTSVLREMLSAYAGAVVLLDADGAEIAAQTATPVQSGSTPADLAYVIFTSGSTGRPKGVEVPHRAVVNLMSWMAKELRMGAGDVFPALASFGFDMSVPELYLPLFSGGTLAMGTAHLAADGEALAKFLQKHNATLVHATPTTWNLLLDAGFTGAGLKRCIGAEPLPHGLFERLMKAAPGTPLWNFYGPTETTVWSTFHCFTSADEDIVIGRPLANTQVYILDAQGQVCPVGVAGEIHIAGDGVADGYRGQPLLTAEKFVRDPFSADASARMYKTADLGKWRADGVIEHMGRADHQVKIRGFRIELGEIEAALATQPGVSECVVIVREDIAGDKRLVAYVVSAEAMDDGKLRAGLKAALPDYMVPSAFVALEQLPLTPNGKVDRKNLPAPSQERSGAGLTVPTTEIEKAIASIWAEVLRLETIGLEDDFFSLGGHSLLATQMISRVRERFETEVPLAEIFANPTLESFAAAVTALVGSGSGTGETSFAVMERPARLPLSYGQQRLWFLDQLEPGSPFYNVVLRWRLRGALDIAVLESALSEIVARHEALRTTYVVDGADPVQVISLPRPVVVPVIDLSSIEESKRRESALAAIAEETRSPFDLGKGPVFRAKLLKLSETDHVLVLNTHHIAIDGWSFGILRQELTALYEAFASGRPSPLPALPLQYADHVVWQRTQLEGTAYAAQVEYWKENLRGAPPSIELPTDRLRPAVQTYRGSSRIAVVSNDVLKELKELSRQEGTTLFMTLLAAFYVLLSRYSGQEDIVIGSAIAGRTHSATEKLIGLFVNTVALRTNVSASQSFRELLRRVRETTLHAYANQSVPFERVIEELNPVRDSSRSPLYQVMMILQNAPSERQGMAGLQISTYRICE